MPISTRLISGQRPMRPQFALYVNSGDQVALSKDIITTGPNRRTYTGGSKGRIRKFYRKGAILQMDDGAKIPVSFDFLNIPAPAIQAESTPMPLPYQTL